MGLKSSSNEFKQGTSTVELTLTHANTESTEVIISDCVDEIEAKIYRFCTQFGWIDQTHEVTIVVNEKELFDMSSSSRIWFDGVSSMRLRFELLDKGIVEFRFICDNPNNVITFIRSMVAYTGLCSTIKVRLQPVEIRYWAPQKV